MGVLEPRRPRLLAVWILLLQGQGVKGNVQNEDETKLKFSTATTIWGSPLPSPCRHYTNTPLILKALCLWVYSFCFTDVEKKNQRGLGVSLGGTALA